MNNPLNPWSRLRDTLHQRSANRVLQRREAGRIDADVERILEASNPRLRAVAGYKKALRPPAIRIAAHCAQVCIQIPGPLTLDSHAWLHDPLVHSLFSSATRLREALSRSPEVRAYCRTRSTTEDIYAVLRINMEKRSVLGMELHGDSPRREVAQTKVALSEHEVVLPAATEQETRALLEDRLFVETVEEAAAGLARRQRDINRLEQQHQTLKTRLRSGTGKSRQTGDDDHALRQQLAHLEKELAAARAGMTDYRDYLARLTELLSDSGTWPNPVSEPLLLDRMNTVREEKDPDWTELSFTRLASGGRDGKVVFIIRFSAAELLPEDHFLDQAERLWGGT